jgi:hypothetical protein
LVWTGLTGFYRIFLYCLTARFAQDAKNAKLNIFSFAVERPEKEKGCKLLLSALSAESKKNNFSATFTALR